jgi:DNA-binding MarR family transcriptional regulator
LILFQLNKLQETLMAAIKGGAGGSTGELIQQLLAGVRQAYPGDTLAIMADSGLTMPQIVTLNILGSQGAHGVSEMAGRLGLSKAATSHLVDMLVKGGFINRVEDGSDRRRKRISITAKGGRFLERLLKSRNEDFDRALGGLPDGLREEFNLALKKVVDEMKDRQPGGDTGGRS